MHNRQTLARSVALEGVGLHSGRPVRMRLVPAPPGTGTKPPFWSVPEPAPTAARAPGAATATTARATTRLVAARLVPAILLDPARLRARPGMVTSRRPTASQTRRDEVVPS